ncbi:MAG: radical SAM protein [Fibromonadales bacterium]|nr:radical SAM protein [Fibromonadales bacterium]
MPYCNNKNITFLLTTRCNLNCSYCYGNRKMDYKTLDFRFAKRALHDFAEKEKLNNICFSADGEPTTEMELLKKIFNEAKQLNPDVATEVVTNGTFNEEIAKWLAENLDYIYISADLLPEAHDKCRLTITGKPSSPPILKNLEFFNKIPNKRAKIGLFATITKHNITQQKEGIDFYFDNFGVDIFWIKPLITPIYDADEKYCESVDMLQFAQTFLDAHAYAWQRKVFYESNLTANFDGETSKACSACIPMPYLTVDGYFSACKLVSYGKNAEKMDSLIYAQYDAVEDKITYDVEKIKMLRNRTLNNMPSECGVCVASKHCAGYCMAEAQQEMGKLLSVKSNVCKAMRYLQSEIGHLYAEKNKQNQRKGAKNGGE